MIKQTWSTELKDRNKQNEPVSGNRYRLICAAKKQEDLCQR